MPQLFLKRSNAIARASLGFVATLPIVAVGIAYALNDSAFVTFQEVPREQPVQFSHEHHVRILGIDCRYCHATVETLAHAGMPTTHTCMSCHSQIWREAEELEPVRRSYRENQPLRWTRVYDLPDFTFFDHSIHVHRGVGCSTCHGQIDRMPLTWLSQPLHMQWCLDCHRDPTPHLRPRDQVFNMSWGQERQPAGHANESSERRAPHEVKGLSQENENERSLLSGSPVGSLTHCYVCHR